MVDGGGEDEGSHASATIVTGDRDTVDDGLRDAGEGAEGLGYFCRGDVFAFPAVGVAEAVEEVPAARGVAAEGVAGAVVEVALCEDVVGEFGGGGRGVVPVAWEGGAAGLDFDEDFAARGVGGPGCEAGGCGAKDGVGVWVDGDGDVEVVGAGAEEGAVVADCVGEEVAWGCWDQYCSVIATCMKMSEVCSGDATGSYLCSH